MAANSTPSPRHATVRTLGPKGRWLQWSPPEGFEWTHATLPVANLPDGLVGTRIIHLSDVHVRIKWLSAYDVLIDAIQDAKPDLLLVTGDFVDDKVDHTPALPTIQKLVAGLNARLGVYGILGNHDQAHFEPRLVGTNVTVLNGTRKVVERDGHPIELIGMPGVYREDLTSDWLDSMHLHDRSPGVPRIVLSHYPDHLSVMRPLKPDVVLAGHTHGGQICLPGGFPIISNDTLPRKYCKGIHDFDGTWLVANRGFGTTGIHIRMFCPSEVIEIELVKE
jgi:predicted MPP superfamily phosphohydrolase